MPEIAQKIILKKYEQLSSFKGGLKETFFPIVTRTTRLKVNFQDYISSDGVAPYASLLAKNYKRNKIETREFEIPCISQQTEVDADSAQVVIQGTNPFTLSDTTTPEYLDDFIYGTSELRDRVLRKQELMVSEVLSTGKLETEDVIDYGRDAKYNITADWSDFSARGVTETMDELFALSSATNLSTDGLVLLLGSDSASAFFKNEEVRSILNNLRYKAIDYTPSVVSGSLYTIGSFIFPNIPVPVTVLNYVATYTDDEGVRKHIFPKNSAVFTSTNSPRHSFYGGVAYAKDGQDRVGSMYVVPGDEVLFDDYTGPTKESIFRRAKSRYIPIPSDINHIMHAEIST